APAAAEVEAADVARRRLADHPAAAPGVRAREHPARHRRARAAAGGAGAGLPRREVADVDARRARAGLDEGERAGEVARHPVVAEGGHEGAAGGLRRGTVALADAAAEAALPPRVAGVRARAHAGAHRRLAHPREP